jgi:hypothetical protein
VFEAFAVHDPTNEDLASAFQLFLGVSQDLRHFGKKKMSYIRIPEAFLGGWEQVGQSSE